MKKLIGLALLLSLCWACEEENFPLVSLEQRFSHEIADCNFGSPEMNCTEFVEFGEKGRADFLLGGGDIVEQGTYERLAQLIILNTGNAFWGTMEFDIQDDSTLIRRSDQSLWTLD